MYCPHRDLCCSVAQTLSELLTKPHLGQLTCLAREINSGVFLSHQASVLHQDLDREPGTVDLTYQRASHFIHPFYSTSRSFLSIVRVPETMPCGEKQNIQVDFRIYQEDLEHGPKRVIFSYFVSFG